MIEIITSEEYYGEELCLVDINFLGLFKLCYGENEMVFFAISPYQVKSLIDYLNGKAWKHGKGGIMCPHYSEPHITLSEGRSTGEVAFFHYVKPSKRLYWKPSDIKKAIDCLSQVNKQ